MQKTVQKLPEGYNEIYSVNLQKDKKTAVIINVIAGVICAAMLAIGHFCFVPLTEFGGSGDSLFLDLLPMLVMLAGIFAYIVLHELTHGAVMKFLRLKSSGSDLPACTLTPARKTITSENPYILLSRSLRLCSGALCSPCF